MALTVIVEEAAPVWGGVDTHSQIHVAAVIDPNGGVIDTGEFGVGCAGVTDLVAWFSRFDIVAVGVEGTGSYGMGVARQLRRAGVRAVEVNRPNRQARRAGKTDLVDAIEAARAVLSGRAVAVPKFGDGPVEAIRQLQVTKRSARHARTQAINQIRQILVTADDPGLEPLKACSAKMIGARAALLKPSVEGPVAVLGTKTSLKMLGHRIVRLDTELDQLDRLIGALVAAAAPDLVAGFGIGVDSAAELLVCAGDNPERIGTEARWAMLCGVAPIPASSGKTQRHRLNRGGNRQANKALHTIALVRMRYDPETKAFINKKVSEGKSKTEAIRCLKRFIAREVWHLLPEHSN